MLEAADRPSYAEGLTVGVAHDADYHSGHIENGRQRWVWVAKRPFSSGTCKHCTAYEAG